MNENAYFRHRLILPFLDHPKNEHLGENLVNERFLCFR